MHYFRILLFPFSIAYWAIIKFRNLLYDVKILKSTKPSIKTICIGNITIGGTGKTPHTEYLIKLLSQNWQIAVLSRGYKRKTKGYIEATQNSTPADIGDEPLQMKLKYPHITVAAESNRLNGINELLKKHPSTEVILLDDAFQHRSITAGLSVLLTDYSNLINQDFMIPVGYLRDSFAERKRANMLVVTKCPRNIKPDEMDDIVHKLRLEENQPVYFSYIEYGMATPVFEKTAPIPINKDIYTIALCGIAKPMPFIKYLENNSNLIDKQIFSDHHTFTEPEIRAIFAPTKRSMDTIIVTTEKDAAKIRSIKLPGNVKQHIYSLGIEVKFIDNQPETFNDKIIQYVREN